MLSLIKYNIKILMSPSYFIGWLFLLCLPFILNFRLLEQVELARISEQGFILVGVIWVSGLLNYEQAAHVGDLVNQMRVKITLIFIIRLLFMIFNMIIAFTMLLFIAHIQGSVFNFGKLLFGSIIGAFMLGMISLLFFQLTKEISVGYLMSFAYYYFELSTKGEYTKYFYLYGLLSGIPYNKLLLMGVSIILLIINWKLLEVG